MPKANEHSQRVPGLQHAAGRDSNGYTIKDLPSPRSQTAHQANGSQWAFKSLDEAKKEAQKAILRLWPLGVKFQHYIDEGFDEKVIKSLFDALHLDISTGRPKEPESRQAPAQDSTSKPEAQAAMTSKPPSAGDQAPAQGQKPAETSKPEAADRSEERKDRIARLLAAKAAKTAPTQPDPPATATTMESGTSASTGKPKTREEKELLLQQKMEALRKSREARAQKAASKEPSPSSRPDSAEASASAAPQPEPDQPEPDQPEPDQPELDHRPAPIQSVTTDTSLTSNTPLPQEAVPEQTPQTSGSIPGLTLSSTEQPVQSINQRKRPVAMDFVDYPSTVGSLKRPFGQEREDSSLVIDVSDASDEEMDIDMDDDSPTEPSAVIQRTDSSARKGPSIRDFPPLTDASQRQYSSPAPPSRTPPTVFPNGKQRVSELDRKEKAIQEMRRKIAEAEAKRKAKKASGGSQTPNADALTPPEPRDGEAPRPPLSRVVSTSDVEMSDGPSAQLISESGSAKLPKPSETRLRDEFRAERRGRIASLDLPRIDGTLQEKMNKLKRLREEEARLQAEIDEGLAEKNKLTDELIQLDEEIPDESREWDGQPVEDASNAPRITPPAVQTNLSPKITTSIGESTGPTTHGSVTEEAAPSPSQNTRGQSPALVDNADPIRDQEHKDDAQPNDEGNEPPERVISPGIALPVAPPQPSTAEVGMNPEQGTAELSTPSAPSDPSASSEPAQESATMGAVMSEPAPIETPQEDGEVQSDSYEPPEPMEQDSADHVTSASSPFSPAPAADSPAADNTDDQRIGNTTGTSPLLAQISLVAQPRDSVQEMEATAIPSEVTLIFAPAKVIP